MICGSTPTAGTEPPHKHAHKQTPFTQETEKEISEKTGPDSADQPQLTHLWPVVVRRILDHL